jgi:hypothetical protein
LATFRWLEHGPTRARPRRPGTRTYLLAHAAPPPRTRRSAPLTARGGHRRTGGQEAGAAGRDRDTAADTGTGTDTDTDTAAGTDTDTDTDTAADTDADTDAGADADADACMRGSAHPPLDAAPLLAVS